MSKKEREGVRLTSPVKVSCNYIFFDASRIKREELMDSAMM